MCPEECEKLFNFLKSIEISFNEFCSEAAFEFEFNLIEEEQNKLKKMYRDLVSAFNRKTGLALYVVYANAEDRGDELDGGSFAVENVYQYTPAGKKYKDKIIKKCWNIFG